MKTHFFFFLHYNDTEGWNTEGWNNEVVSTLALTVHKLSGEAGVDLLNNLGISLPAADEMICRIQQEANVMIEYSGVV